MPLLVSRRSWIVFVSSCIVACLWCTRPALSDRPIALDRDGRRDMFQLAAQECDLVGTARVVAPSMRTENGHTYQVKLLDVLKGQYKRGARITLRHEDYTRVTFAVGDTVLCCLSDCPRGNWSVLSGEPDLVRGDRVQSTNPRMTESWRELRSYLVEAIRDGDLEAVLRKTDLVLQGRIRAIEPGPGVSEVYLVMTPNEENPDPTDRADRPLPTVLVRDKRVPYRPRYKVGDSVLLLLRETSGGWVLHGGSYSIWAVHRSIATAKTSRLSSWCSRTPPVRDISVLYAAAGFQVLGSAFDSSPKP